MGSVCYKYVIVESESLPRLPQVLGSGWMVSPKTRLKFITLRIALGFSN